MTTHDEQVTSTPTGSTPAEAASAEMERPAEDKLSMAPAEQPQEAELPPTAAEQPQESELPPTAAEQPQESELPPTAAEQPQEAELPPAEIAEPSADELLFADDNLSMLRSRWDDVQTAFVDDPTKCVQEADLLVAEVVDQLAASFSGARSRLESQWARGEDVSTEDLRLALRRYREFFERLLAV